MSFALGWILFVLAAPFLVILYGKALKWLWNALTVEE
jgi:hypothetical protein